MTEYRKAPKHWSKPESCTCEPGIYREPAPANRAERRKAVKGQRYLMTPPQLVHEHGCGIEQAVRAAQRRQGGQ